MTTYRCQVRLPFFTAIPEDVSTNTLYFSTLTADPVLADANAIVGRLTAFYQAINTNFSPVISRATDACEIRLYDMDAPEPRAPLFGPYRFTLGTPPTGALPNELALVMSFQADPVSGVPQARRRGRIYLGPLAGGVAAAGTTTAFPRPTTSALTAIASAAQTHLQPTGAGDIDWVVWSQTDGIGWKVTNGWLNNEFDTQRRRGVEATARSLFVPLS